MASSRTRFAAPLVLLIAVTTTACGTSGGDVSTGTVPPTTAGGTPIGDRPSVAVAFYPVEFLVDRVAGDAVEIVRLVEPGEPAHDAQLTAATLDRLADADAVFYLGDGFQTSVEDAIDELPATVTAVDLLAAEGVVPLKVAETDDTSDDKGHDHAHGDEGHDHAHGDEDPHVWLDPANMAAMAREISTRLTVVAPDSAATFEANLASLTGDLDALGAEIDATFDECRSRTLVTAHDAFGHLARRARLDTAPIAGVNPQDEPSARELEAIAETARSADVDTVFFENALPDALARTVADAIGADVDVLDSVEEVGARALADGADYLSLMRENVRRIAAGLGCS